MSKLSALLNQANRNDWSSRDIEREANQRGHKLTYSTVARYMSGKHGNPTHQVLAALADTLGVDVNGLREAAGMPDIGESFILPVESSRLSAGQRNAILHVVRVMLDDDQTSGHEAASDYRLAAHRGEPDVPKDRTKP